jgi:rhomboid protease GluP
MLNDPPPEKRRAHPLEQGPNQPPPAPTPPSAQPPPERHPVMLHIPSVTPRVTYAVLLINILVFIIRLTSPALDEQIFMWGANHQPYVLQNGEYYRLFSSMFLHASIYSARGGFALENSLHLIFNMYILYSIGTALERLFGHARFAIIYLLGGVTGSVLSTVFSDANVFSVGASGAVFAVLGAEFVYLYQHRKLLGARGRRQMQSLISLAVINLVFGLVTTVSTGPIRVDNWAHIGGALGGLLLAWFIGPIFIVSTHPTQPNALIGEDINPLRNKYGIVSLYAAALLLVLIFARQIALG